MTNKKKKNIQYDISKYLPFWPKLEDEQKRLLLALKPKTYAAGEKLMFSPGDRYGFLLVLEGDIRVYISSPGGREFTLYHSTAGQFCSLMPMDGQGTPTLEAYCDSTLIHISMDILLPILAYYPENANYFLARIGNNLQDVLNNIEHAFFNPLRSSVARIILENCPGDSDTVRITHEQIANHFGTTREVVSREIEGFRDMGLIVTGRGRISIIDRAGLETLSGN